MELFVRIAETRNFSALAKERRIGQPTISKQISALEAELGAELLHRNTRPITLTEAGREYRRNASLEITKAPPPASVAGR
jgi:DNA-binding transcriptional LysR family regulator